LKVNKKQNRQYCQVLLVVKLCLIYRTLFFNILQLSHQSSIWASVQTCLSS